MIKTSTFYFWFWCGQMYNLQKTGLKTLGQTPGSSGTLSVLTRRPHPDFSLLSQLGPCPEPGLLNQAGGMVRGPEQGMGEDCEGVKSCP